MLGAITSALTRIRNLFSRNIQVRLTCYFLLILVPLVTISIYAVERSQNILYDRTVERSQMALSSVMDYIDLTIQSAEQLSTLVATDPTLVRLLEQNGSELTPQSILDFMQILKQLNNVKSSNHIVQKISIYHEPSRTLLSTSYGARKLIPGEQQWMKNTFDRIGTGILYQTADDDGINYLASSSSQTLFADDLSLVRAMDIYNQRRAPNMLVLTLNKNKLLAMMKTLLPSPNAYVSLYDQDGKLITEVGDSATRAALTKNSSPSSDLSVTVQSKYSNWKMTMLQPKNEVFSETNTIQSYTYLIVSLSLLLAFVISWTVYKGIAAPIKQLAQGMKQMSVGKMNVRVDHKRRDELGFLTDAFNQMAENQKHLIEDHYEQQLRIAKTELKFLQSQINPHFLYNTLDSIYWTSKNYEADEIGEMVLNLSKFFRLSLNKGKEVFTVQESVEHLHYYVRIQQLKFLDSFDVVYDIEEATKPITILKLLLQPLVENAILHGMEGREQGGLLTVASRIEGDMLVLEVTDNGNGLTEERLHYVQTELERLRRRDFRLLSLIEEETMDLFGLRNVATRIRLYYGEQADLSISSRLGEGTSVRIRLPLDRCRHDIMYDAFGGGSRNQPEEEDKAV